MSHNDFKSRLVGAASVFARAFLGAKGLTGVDALFDALNPKLDPANDAGAPVSNDLTSPILGGYIHVAS